MTVATTPSSLLVALCVSNLFLCSFGGGSQKRVSDRCVCRLRHFLSFVVYIFTYIVQDMSNFNSNITIRLDTCRSVCSVTLLKYTAAQYQRSVLRRGIVTGCYYVAVACWKATDGNIGGIRAAWGRLLSLPIWMPLFPQSRQSILRLGFNHSARGCLQRSAPLIKCGKGRVVIFYAWYGDISIILCWKLDCFEVVSLLTEMVEAMNSLSSSKSCLSTACRINQMYSLKL